MSADAEIQKGDILRQQGQLEAAATAYQEAIRNNPQSVEAYQHLAGVLHELGNLDQAAYAYQRAIALHPDANTATPPSSSANPAAGTPEESLPPTVAQLQTLLDQKDWSGAIALGQQIVEKSPSAPVLKLLGMALQFEGQLDEALEAYRHALELKPDWAEVWANIGSIRAQQQQWDLAIECYEQAIARKPTFAGVYRNLARVYEKLGYLQRATDCWYQAMLLAPEQSTAQDAFQLGKQLLTWKQVDWAINCFQIALQKDPSFIEARQQLANAVAQQGQQEHAQPQAQSDSPPDSTTLETASAPSLANPSPQVDTRSSDQKLAIAKTQLQTCMAEQNWQGVISYSQYLLEHEPDGEIYRLLGNALQQMSNLDAAQRAYETALEYEPDSAKTYTNLGTLYVQRQQWDEAVRHFKQAIALQPDFAGAYRNLARAWQTLEKTESATECWYQALRLEPEKLSAAEHTAFGDRFRQWGQPDRAVECYQFALQQTPSLVKTRQSLAEVLSQLGRWQEAVEQYQTLTNSNLRTSALGLAPHETSSIPKVVDTLQRADLSNPKVLLETAALLAETEKECLERAIAGYRDRGNAAQANQDWKTATYYYTQVIQLDAHSAIDWSNLGTLYARQEQWEEAIQCYNRAIALDENRASFYWNVAQVLSKLERTEEATEAYHRALILEPERATPEQHCALGKVFSAQDKLDTAVECYEQALQLDPSYIEARFHWAGTLIKQGNLTNAIEQYQLLVATEPENGQYWHHLGDTLLKLERYEEAKDAYKRAIALSPDFSWSHNNLGDALSKLERWQDAVKAYERAIALNPNFHWSYYNLGEALTQIEDWDGAIEAYQKAHEIDLENPYIKRKIGTTLRLRANYDQRRASLLLNDVIKKKSDSTLDDYHQAIELEPLNGNLHQDLSNTLSRAGRNKEALVFSQIAEQVNGAKVAKENQDSIHFGQFLLTGNNKNISYAASSRRRWEPISNNPIKRILFSALFFYAEDRTKGFLSSVPQKIIEASKAIGVEPAFIFRDHTPEPDYAIEEKINKLRHSYPDIEVIYIKGPNIGFAAGHNRNFQLVPSDAFAVVNNDIDVPDFNFLSNVIENFNSNAYLAAIGAEGTPTHMQTDFAYVPDKQSSLLKRDYAEASLLFLKSSIFKKVGMFDEQYTYAYFEDVDLSLRLRQSGFEINHIRMPFQHFRSSSASVIPEQVRATVYEYNRARFMSRWSRYLKQRTLSGRILINLSGDGIGDLVDSFYPVKKLVDEYSKRKVEVVIQISKSSLYFLFSSLNAKVQVLESQLPEQQQEYDQVFSLENLNYSAPLHTIDLIAAKLGVCDFSTDPSIAQASIQQTVDPFNLPNEYAVVHLDSQRAGFEGRSPNLATCLPALKRILKDYEIILVGMPFTESHRDEAYEFFVSNQDRIHDLRGLTSVEQLALIVSKAKVFFGVDSGPMHFAQLFNVPTLAIFGPIHPWTKLYRLENSGAIFNLDRQSDSGSYHRTIEPSYHFCMRRDEACIKQISEEHILSVTHLFFANNFRFDWNTLVDHLRYRQREWLYLQIHNPIYRNRLLTNSTFSAQTLSNLIINVCEVFESRAKEVVEYYLS